MVSTASWNFTSILENSHNFMSPLELYLTLGKSLKTSYCPEKTLKFAKILAGWPYTSVNFMKVSPLGSFFFCLFLPTVSHFAYFVLCAHYKLFPLSIDMVMNPSLYGHGYESCVQWVLTSCFMQILKAKRM